MTDKIFRLPKVKEATGLSRSTIYEMIERGDFPRPIQLAPRAVGWIETEISDWISERITATRNAA